ncbi:MAG: hypothetical protein M1816_002353 [Peltula sp. TS41687]|nr:MAG: hypothetical protein M1816_002353 [Peltula sp. TS41687]
MPYQDHALNLCWSSLLALKTLHDHGYAHGDICPDNFALVLRDISDVTEEAMRELLGEPVVGKVYAVDESPVPPSMPPYLVSPVSVRRLLPLSHLSLVKMIDLGQGTNFYVRDKSLPWVKKEIGKPLYSTRAT